MKIIGILINILPYKSLLTLKKMFKVKRNDGAIFNININSISNQKRILLSYTTDVFMNVQSYKSTRIQESQIIIQSLIENHFVVDVVDCNNNIVTRNDYDIILGFGKAFRNACANNQNAKKILYLTEKPPSFSKEKEKERIEYFYERHRKRINYTRSGLYYNDEDFSFVNAILYVGTENDKIYLPKYILSHPIRVTGLQNTNYSPQYRIIENSKKHFLWLGSLGAIHKGLDILIDVFNEQTDVYLHICGLSIVEKKLLPKILDSSIIIDHGFVDINSNQFLEIANTCSFIIMPSCSEAISTSVITATLHGLIPLVTRETSFEIDECGQYLDLYSVEYIASVIEKWSNMDDSVLELQQNIVRKNSLDKYNLDSYKKTFINFLNKMV